MKGGTGCAKFPLDKPCRIPYSIHRNKTDRKGHDEEEYASPLVREDSRFRGSVPGKLRGCPKEGMQKVASEPGIRKPGFMTEVSSKATVMYDTVYSRTLHGLYTGSSGMAAGMKAGTDRVSRIIPVTG